MQIVSGDQVDDQRHVEGDIASEGIRTRGKEGESIYERRTCWFAKHKNMKS